VGHFTDAWLHVHSAWRTRLPIAQSALREALHPHALTAEASSLYPNSLTLTPLTSRTTTSSCIPSLHLQILYAHNPTLTFIGTTISFIPFLLADLTSTWLGLAWSGTIAIPATAEERLDYERIRLDALATQHAETGNPSNLVNFHFLGRDELSYAQAIRNDIVGTRPRCCQPPAWQSLPWPSAYSRS
jgi:hypothetical protein